MNTTPAASDGPKAVPQDTHLVAEFKHASPLLSCRFDPSGQFVFATAYDNTIQRWHLASGKVAPLVAHDSWVRALAFHPSGSTLYSGGYDGRVIWWEITSEAPAAARTIEAHQGWVRAVAVSPDGNLLATCGNDNLVKIWSATDGTLFGDCIGHANHVYNVAFHPDGRTLVSGDLKGVVREWDVATCEQLRQFDAAALWKYDAGFGADIGGVRGISFSADRKLLACGGITEVSNAFAGIGFPLVVVIDVETGQARQQHVTEKKLKGPIWNVRYHRDGYVIGASGGHDGGHVLFWKIEQANEFFDFKLPDICRDFDLHPDQLRLATSHEDKSVRIWQMTAKAK
jgi:WD40 repeat protein